jgi:hypothetical protein
LKLCVKTFQLVYSYLDAVLKDNKVPYFVKFEGYDFNWIWRICWMLKQVVICDGSEFQSKTELFLIKLNLRLCPNNLGLKVYSNTLEKQFQVDKSSI